MKLNSNIEDAFAAYLREHPPIGTTTVGDLYSAFCFGYKRGEQKERAMWELARDSQEWEIDVDQNAFDHS